MYDFGLIISVVSQAWRVFPAFKQAQSMAMTWIEHSQIAEIMLITYMISIATGVLPATKFPIFVPPIDKTSLKF